MPFLSFPVRSAPRMAAVAGLLVAALLLAPRSARAQDEPEAGADDPQLPEIAPREIEIRGELQINLPSLQRQPLTGFRVPSSLPEYPSDRLPPAETYTQDLDALPQSRPELQLVSPALSASADPATGQVEAGGGRYFHRFVDGRLDLPLTTYESILVEGSYEGTNGHEPFPESSIDTPYDDLDGAVRFQSRRSAATVRANVRGAYESYTLFGARPLATPLPRSPHPDRTGQIVGGGASVSTHGRIPVSLGVQFDRTASETQIRPDSIADARSFEESRFRALGSISVPAGASRIDLDAQTTVAGLDGRGVFEGDVATLDAGGTALLLRQGPFRVTGGARLLTFRSLIDPTRAESPTASATFFSPAFRAEWQAAPTLRVYAQNRPRLSPNDLSAILQTNPYVGPTPGLRPTLETTRAETGVEVTTGPVRITASAGYRYAPSFLYFAPDRGSGYETGVFRAAYESAQIIHGGGSIALQGLDRVQASLGIRVRDGQLTDGDRSIPNFAPLTTDAMVSVSFLEDRAFLRMTAEVLSPRPVDANDSADVGTYADIDIEGSFEVSPLLDVVARIENIGATERWNRYERPPAVVSGGLRIHW